MRSFSDNRPQPSRLVRNTIALCFLLSGAAGLIYEVVWTRQLVLVFGSTTVAVSTILAAFMGGLAVGSWLIGRWSDRLQDSPARSSSLTAYGLLECGIALSSLLVAQAFQGLSAVYPGLWQATHESVAALGIAQFVLVGLLLLIPTMLMGGSLPLLVRWAVQGREQVGLTTGRLYALNTAGAVAGAALSGLWFLPALGVQRTTWIAVGLNLAVGVAVLVVARRQGCRPPGRPVRLLSFSDPDMPDQSPRPQHARLVLLIACLSGFAALGYEVAWTRVLTLVLGSSTYAFTLMLVTFLIGLAGGSALAARVTDRLPAPVLGLAMSQATIAALAFGGLYCFTTLPLLYLTLYRWTDGSWELLLAGQGLLAFLVMIGPTLGLGAMFPLIVKLCSPSRHRIGTSVGRAYAMNTLGAVVGATATGIWLIPSVGLRSTLLLLILTNLLLSLMLVPLVECRRALKAVAAGGLAAAVAGVWFGAPSWQPLVMTSGVFKEAPHLARLYAEPKDALRGLKLGELLYYREGQTATVSVVEKPLVGLRRHVALAVDGKVDASTGADMTTQVLSGHLPLLLAPSAESVVVIGYASGMTAGAVLQHQTSRHLTIVEIEPAVMEASRYFDEFNHQPLTDPRVEVVLADARTYLGATSAQFDVIISEPSNPWLSGPAKLFTEEFFRLGRAHLGPQGVFAQWLQLYGMAPEYLRALVRTFQAAFPSVMIFQIAPGDLLLLGSQEPLRLDYQVLTARLAEPAVAADLQRIGLTDVAGVLATFLVGPREVAAYTGSGLHNTDDNGLIEFAAPRSLYAETITENRATLEQAGSWVWRYLINVGEADDDWANVLLAIGRRAVERKDWRLAEAASQQALRVAPSPEAHVLLGKTYARTGSPVSARTAWHRAVELDPTSRPARLKLARLALSQGHDHEAAQHLGALRPTQQPEPELAFLSGLILYRQGRWLEAAEVLQSAAVKGPREPDLVFVHYYVSQAYAELGNQDLAARHRTAFLADLALLRLSWERIETQADLLAPNTLKVGSYVIGQEAEARRLLQLHVVAPLQHYYQGVTFFLLGYEEQAVKEFLEVLRLVETQGGSTLTHYYLGLAYNRLDQDGFAAAHLREFLNTTASDQTLAALRADAVRRLATLTSGDLKAIHPTEASKAAVVTSMEDRTRRKD